MISLPDVNLQANTVAFLQREQQKMLINNEWVAAVSGDTFTTVDPATGKQLATLAAGDAADVDRAVAAARAAFTDGAWPKMSGADRGDLLWKIAAIIDAHGDELAELETLDNGKPLRTARYGDVAYAAKHFRYYAGWASKIEGTTIPVSIPNQFVYTTREPMGVVGLIIPWNFPLLMAAWKLAPALAAGNTVVLKPAGETSLSALRLGELMVEAGVPAGVVNIVTGLGAPAGAALTAHMDVDKVAFTGSTAVGRKVMAAAAGSNLKRVSLELGGKSPNVIFADADIARAVKGATWAIFSTAGQECVAGSRLFVQRSVYDEVADGLRVQAAKIRVGSGFGRNHIGPIVSKRQIERVLGYIDEGKAAGMDVLSGGERLGGELADGYFLQPTIFAHENDSLKLVQEEIFGPVAAITPFDDWDELTARANATRYGLAAGAWTRDLSKAHRFAAAVKAGTVWINSYGLFDAAAPFGGYKESGFGREMGKDAIDLYTQVKTVWVGI